MEGHDIENPYIPLVTLVEKALEGLPLSSDSCCIYRVPERLRCVKEKAYTPQVVSIGPIHHGNKGLEDMEEHKTRYLQYFLRRSKVSLEDYVKKIKGKEAELRGCYAHTIELCTDKFVRIILVDAAFIIELLLRYCSIIQPDSNDRIFHKPCLIKDIAPDMLLLENQLPFFILKDLFATGEVPTTNLSVLELSYRFCKQSTSLHVDKDKLKSILCFDPCFTVKHFVDLIGTLHLPAAVKDSENRGRLESLAIPSMTKLHQAGVKFEVSSSKNLFDICFQDGTLEIPKLEIDDCTEQELRNLIAFEQCHFDRNYFSDYISLMDDLVNTSHDVELLVKNGIVENLLGDNNEVSTLINSLGNGVLVDKEEFYFATLSKALNKYYGKSWNKSKAELRQKYFETPWKTISVIAATCIIILTLIQTVWTVAY
ncbi:UPF0481 protein At3g47200-like [Malus sylvestris]|uniref:UPF0481 protein At3g47200-like n=1 Tax=Malus sylvestris TaxID=3752 RepID=UPI0021ACBF45|nr:UPF0481 protein At3g47200-like [Malus sylvestris]